jgi:hypothetical protein
VKRRQTATIADTMIETVDEVLRSAAHSPLIDSDAEKETRREDRAKKLSELAGLFPGAWRGRKAKA